MCVPAVWVPGCVLSLIADAARTEFEQQAGGRAAPYVWESGLVIAPERDLDYPVLHLTTSTREHHQEIYGIRRTYNPK